MFLIRFVRTRPCGPSRATILTGNTVQNGFMRNGNRFNPDQWTVAKELQKGGYHTAVIGKWHLDPPRRVSTTGKSCRSGHYYNPVFIQQEDERTSVSKVTPPTSPPQAIAWLDGRRTDKEKPFF